MIIKSNKRIIYELNSNMYKLEDDSNMFLEQEFINLLNSLKKYRKYLGISQTELANKSGLTLRTIVRIESANSNISLKTFLKYIKSLELDLEIS